MQVHVTVTGLDNAEGRLTRLGESLYDFTVALTSLGAKLLLFYGETVFNTTGRALGATWAPLADSTKREKENEWPGRNILQRTGALQRGFYTEVTPQSLFVGNKVPYFPFHQLGTGIAGGKGGSTSKLGSLARAYSIGGSGRGRNLPARPMIGINATVEGFIKAAFAADIKAKIDSTNV